MKLPSNRKTGLLLLLLALLGLTGCTVVDVRTITGPNDTPCGGFDWQVAFTLKDPSPRGGWIIQEIQANQTSFNCPGGLNLNLNTHYWEAWQVAAGGNHPTLRDTLGITFDDEYTMPDRGATHGTTTATGTIRFFQNVTLPPGFVQNNPNTFAGILHSDTHPPPFWNTVSDQDSHDFRNEWDCCVNPPTRSVHTKPTIGGLQPVSKPPLKPSTPVGNLIESIPPWKKTSADNGARQLRSVAREIGSLPTPAIREGIHDFLNAHKADEESLDSLSKVYVLLRVLFAVPTSIDRKEAKVYGGWVHPSIVEQGPTFNLMWPLGLNQQSEIVFVGEFQGYYGSTYDALGEFDYFSSKFSRRKLR